MCEPSYDVYVRVSNGYGDLPAVTVSYFWANHVESRVGVVTPHFGRQIQLLPLSLFDLSGSFYKRVKIILSSLIGARKQFP